MKSFEQLNALAWPLSRLNEAVEALAQKQGFLDKDAAELTRPLSQNKDNSETVEQWLERITNNLGLELEAVATSYADVPQMIREAGPALLRLPSPPAANPADIVPAPHFLALLKGNWQYITIIGPDFVVQRVNPATIQAALTHPLETPHLAEIEQLLTQMKLPEIRQGKATTAILQAQLGKAVIDGCWLVRLSPDNKLWRQARQLHMPRHFAWSVGGHVADRLLLLSAWWLVGQIVLQGHVEWFLLMAWSLVLFTRGFFRVTKTHTEKLLAVGLGILLKQQLLYRALRLNPDKIHRQGAGQFLGQIIETETIEDGGAIGISNVLGPAVELILYAIVLAQGVGGVIHALLLLLWLVVPGLISAIYHRHYLAKYNHYGEMTNNLLERMVGHKTCLVQEDPVHQYEAEDQALERYLNLSKHNDKVEVWLLTMIPVGWLALSIVAISYSFIFKPVSAYALGISFLGTLLAFEALLNIVWGLPRTLAATAAWQQLRHLFQPLAQPANETTNSLPDRPTPDLERISIPGTANSGDRKVLLAGRNLFFRYQTQSQSILQRCNLRIRTGDRLLLRGASGGGKSSLVSLLAGLRLPDSGLLLLGGLDRSTLGIKNWRQQIIVVPQFHENYIFNASLGFNLLMGRRWPPHPEDLQEAETVCHELGLGELMNRMPAGLQQLIGEDGWQLSHGEQSQLYIARALLQPASLLILDESLAAIDPENLPTALQCVLNRTSTLMVVTHS